MTTDVNSLFDLEECLTISDKTSSILIVNIVLADHILKKQNYSFIIITFLSIFLIILTHLSQQMFALVLVQIEVT